MVVLRRPRHPELAHPFLKSSISGADRATTAWQVHLHSFADLLRLVAESQRRRWPDRVTGSLSSECTGSIAEVAIGFRLLILRQPDLGELISGTGLPTLTYPVRTFPGNAQDKILIVDGWSGTTSGLLALTEHVAIDLDGNLSGVEEIAWHLFHKLGVFLDATLRIQEIKGPLWADYEAEGWTGIVGFRQAAGSYRVPTEKPRIRGGFGLPEDFQNSDL